MNKGYEITARVPSIMIAGGSNFPVRKKEKQNAAADKNMEEYREIQGLPKSAVRAWAVSVPTTRTPFLRACLKTFDKNGGMGDNRKKQVGAGENASIPK